MAAVSKEVRDWGPARAKVEREGRCRVCGSTRGLEAAHTIGRSHDQIVGKRRLVHEDDTVPLCRLCHRAYDARALDLLPYLTTEEQARAVSHVGIVGALRRLSGRKAA